MDQKHCELERFRPELVRFAMGQFGFDHASSDDLVQSVFLSVLKLPSPETLGDIRAYLFRCVYNAGKTEKSARKHQQEKIDAYCRAKQSPVEHASDRGMCFHELVDFIQRKSVLSAMELELLLLRSTGMKHSEIAKNQQRTYAAVRNSFVCILEKIRCSLSNDVEL